MKNLLLSSLTLVFTLLQCSSAKDISVQDKSNSIELLKKAFESEAFSVQFFICQKPQHKNFRLFDKTSFFEEGATIFLPCNEGLVEVSHTMVDREKYYEPYNLILESVSQIDEVFTLIFYRPYSGGVVNIKFKRIGNDFVLEDYVVGDI